MSTDNATSALYGLIGAVIGAGAAVITSFAAMKFENKKYREERRDQREKDLRNLVSRYLVISQDIG